MISTERLLFTNEWASSAIGILEQGQEYTTERLRSLDLAKKCIDSPLIIPEARKWFDFSKLPGLIFSPTLLMCARKCLKGAK